MLAASSLLLHRKVSSVSGKCKTTKPIHFVVIVVGILVSWLYLCMMSHLMLHLCMTSQLMLHLCMTSHLMLHFTSDVTLMYNIWCYTYLWHHIWCYIYVWHHIWCYIYVWHHIWCWNNLPPHLTQYLIIKSHLFLYYLWHHIWLSLQYVVLVVTSIIHHIFCMLLK